MVISKFVKMLLAFALFVFIIALLVGPSKAKVIPYIKIEDINQVIRYSNNAYDLVAIDDTKEIIYRYIYGSIKVMADVSQDKGIYVETNGSTWVIHVRSLNDIINNAKAR